VTLVALMSWSPIIKALLDADPTQWKSMLI
jgi:hypothetical protein